MKDPVVGRMQALVTQWENEQDAKAVFLRCYRLMTVNTLRALDDDSFADPVWVEKLLRRFATYYFDALAAYESSPDDAPPVWRATFDVCSDGRAGALCHLLLGVNAHINYDLVLTLADLLEPEWATCTDAERAARYQDHRYVNDIIALTVDAVQDDVLDPLMPAMNVLDALLGPMDEYLVSRLIASWRETVWENAGRLLAARECGTESTILHEVETDTLRIASVLRRVL